MWEQDRSKSDMDLSSSKRVRKNSILVTPWNTVEDIPGNLQRRLFMNPRWSRLGLGKDVRRSHSFNVRPTSMAEGIPQSPEQQSPTPMKKKHKPLCVKKLAAKDIENSTISGYMERRSFSGHWIRYWYVLKDGTLFCYLTPDDNVTADILNITGYKLTSLIDKFRGKRFVLQLQHEEYASTYLSVDSREEMSDWLETLEKATAELPCANGAPEEEVFNTEVPVEQYQDKCTSVKQKLLAEMLRQKHELERKQASRQKNKLQQSDTDRLLQTWSPESDEKLISDVTKLRQRRMSAQIKVDVIQKQMQPQQTSNKKFFNFGGKKKHVTSNNEHLEGQLKELTDKLQKIDQDLSSHNYLVAKTSNDFDQRNNFESGLTDSKKDSDSNKNGSNLKSSVQKLAQKKFSKSFKNRHKKENGSILNGHLESPTSESRGFPGDDLVDGGQDSDSDKYKSGSLTDLTKDKLNNNELKLDLSFADQYDESSPKRTSRKNENGSNFTSPRREIDPSVMAEIEAFEELTRQALLSSRSTTS